jgi:hypothetical protein
MGGEPGEAKKPAQDLKIFYFLQVSFLFFFKSAFLVSIFYFCQNFLLIKGTFEIYKFSHSKGDF